MTNNRPRVCFVTLGCKVNQADSSAIAQLFWEADYQIVTADEPADVVVVNTCTVTNIGDSKSRQLIRRMVRKHPESLVVVMGCYAQAAPDEILEIEGVDLVFGTQGRSGILDWIERVKKEGKPQNALGELWRTEEFEEFESPEGYEKSKERFQPPIKHRTRAFLKIQDGCDQNCTYCIIPAARGPSRSRRPENVLTEARRFVENGCQEIVLTGIHTGYYGLDFGEESGQVRNLASLINQLTDINGLRRLRLSSIEPMEYTDELIGCIAASAKVCPHVQIPLQSGSDRVLAKMNRPYTVKEYKILLDKFRQKIPDLAVTTDIIAGFPGETEEDHSDTLAFVEKCGFAGINVFPYSRRTGTPAASYPAQVPKQVKERRVKDLLQAARRSQRAFVQSFLGRETEVLVERIDSAGRGIGHTPHYITVRIPAGFQGEPLAPGKFVRLVLEEGMVYPPSPRQKS